MAPPTTQAEDIARVCHEANRAYALTFPDPSNVDMGPWDCAPEWQRRSAINGVAFALDHPKARPEDSHQSWTAEKVADGWTYGPVKDPVAKTHPCLVPYEQLPEGQRRKDALFLAIVRALA